MTKKVIVTGATSFLGINLIKKLLLYDYLIYAVTRPDSIPLLGYFDQEKVRIIPLDMSQYDKIGKKIDSPCDTFFHFAWKGARGNHRDDQSIQDFNLENSTLAIKEAITLGCKTIIDAGSTAEYGPRESIITENDPCRPNTEYGKAKYKLFEVVTELTKKNLVRYIHPRIFSLYGPGDGGQTLIPFMIRKMLAGEKVSLTACTQKWDFLHIQDACEGIMKLSESVECKGIYNFGSGDNRVLKEFVEIIYKTTKSKSKVVFGEIAYPKTGRVSLELDITKLLQETSWTPKVLFEEGIKDVILPITKDNRREN